MSNPSTAAKGPLVSAKHSPLFAIGFLLLAALAFYFNVLTGAANFWEDLVYQEFPNRVFLRDCFAAGIFPHWNPYMFSGMPFFAAVQGGVLYPLNWPLMIIPFSDAVLWRAITVNIVFHVFLSGLLMFLYARSRKFSITASTLAGLGYMFCGFFVTHIVHAIWMLYGLAWLPLIFLFLDRAFSKNHIGWLAAAGVLLGITMLPGSPQTTFYEFLLVGAYALFMALVLPGKKVLRLVFIALLFALAAGTCAVQVLPTAEAGNQSSRHDWTFEEASEGSISPAHLLMFAMPKFFGSYTGPGTGDPAFWLPGPHSGYWSYYDTNFYTGIAVLLLGLLAFVGIKKDRFAVFSALWLLGSLSLAMGCYFFVYRFFFEYVPGFDKFRSPGRLLLSWNFLLPLLAASVLDGLKDPAFVARLKKPALVLLCLAGILGLMGLAGAFGGFFQQLADAKNAAHASTQGMLLLMNCILFGTPLLLLIFGRIPARTARILIVAAFAIDLFSFGLGHHQQKGGEASAYFHKRAPDLTAALKNDFDTSLARYSVRQFALDDTSLLGKQTGLMLLDRSQGMVDRVPLLEGYQQLNLYRRLPPARGAAQFPMLLDLMSIKYFVNPAYSEASPQIILLNPSRLPRAKLFYRATVLKNDTLVKAAMMKGYAWRSEVLLEKDPGLALSNDSTMQGTATITTYSPNEIKLDVSTPQNGILWLSEIWYPAWKVYVDGKKSEVLCADYSFRAVALSSGSHNVRFVYESDAFNKGMWITLITLIAALGMLIAGFVLIPRFSSP